MSYGTALWKGSTTDIGFGDLALGFDGTLSIRTPDGAAELALDLPVSPFVDVYVAQDWLCAVGAAGRQLVVGQSEGPRVDVIAELDRLDRGGRYDSGAHAARFQDRPGHDQCVFTWEIGVGLVDHEEGFVWAHVHHDVNQRLVRTTETDVELMGVDKALTIAFEGGSVSERVLRGRE